MWTRVPRDILWETPAYSLFFMRSIKEVCEGCHATKYSFTTQAGPRPSDRGSHSTGTDGSETEILCDTEHETRGQNRNTQNQATRLARVNEKTLLHRSPFQSQVSRDEGRVKINLKDGRTFLQKSNQTSMLTDATFVANTQPSRPNF